MFSGSRPVDDQQLVDYLLGALPDDETQRLDELSITDDEFAWRLNSVENDLVDAYVRGELAPAARERFRAAYLSSEERREKVTFAEALARRSAPGVAVRRWSIVPYWRWAAACLVLAAASSVLFYQNSRLRNELARQTAAKSAALARAQDLQRLIGEQASRQAEAPPPSRGPERPVNIATFLLTAQSRDVRAIDTISIPAGTDRVILQLLLESDDFPAYAAEVRDPGTNRRIWSGSGLKAKSARGGRMVSIELPRDILKVQHYSVELTGASVNGVFTFAGSYAFRVVE